jgi:hypothetical protein
MRCAEGREGQGGRLGRTKERLTNPLNLFVYENTFLGTGFRGVVEELSVFCGYTGEVLCAAFS